MDDTKLIGIAKDIEADEERRLSAIRKLLRKGRIDIATKIVLDPKDWSCFQSSVAELLASVGEVDALLTIAFDKCKAPCYRTHIFRALVEYAPDCLEKEALEKIQKDRKEDYYSKIDLAILMVQLGYQ